MARFPRTLGDVLAETLSAGRDVRTSVLSVPELAQIHSENLAANIIDWDKLHPEVQTDLENNATQITDLNNQLNTELPALQTALDENAAKVDAAQADVAQAQIDIEAATSQAVDAQTTADGKGRIWYQTTAPTPPRVQDLWFDTSEGVGKYVPKRYDPGTSTWVSSSDKIATEANAVAAEAQAGVATATTKANAAQAKADQATIDAANAKTVGDAAAAAGAAADAKAVAAQAKADQATIDAANAKAAGDAAASAAATADAKAVAAQNKANQATTDAANAKAAGDAAAAAAATADAKGVAAQTAANNAASAASAAQTSANNAATAAATADAKGVAAQTAASNAASAASAAQTDATQALTNALTADNKAVAAQTSANGKNKVTYSLNTASGANTAGDIWFQKDANGVILAQWEGTGGTSWSPKTLGSAVIAALDAGKISAGTLDAARIAASTIGAEKLLVGDFTNLTDGGNFDTATDLLNWNALPTGVSLVTASPYAGTGCLQANPDAAVRVLTLKNKPSVKEGDRYWVSYWFKSTADWNGTASNSKFRVGDQSGALKLAMPFGSASTTWVERTAEFVVPAGVTSIQLTLNFDQTVGTAWVDSLSMRRKNGGELIVDGTITANNIKTGEITATQIKAASLTSASGIFGTIDASVINAGTINAARMQASDIRTLFLTAGKITASDIVAGSLTSASGIFGTLDASVINAGTINAARFNAGDIRAKFIEAGKITASDITAGTLTSASGVFGTIDASIINAGTLNAARLNAGDVRAKFIAAGTINANEITAGTLTSASGVFGTIDASVINAGTINAARLNATDIRTKFLTAGKITAGDIVAGTLTSASGIFGDLDASIINVGTLDASRIAAGSIVASKLTLTDLTSFAPPLAIAPAPTDWTFSGGMSAVGTSIDPSGVRLDNNATTTGTSWAYGPYMSVAPGESLYGTGTSYRSSGATGAIYLRYYFYDKDKTYLSYVGAPQASTAAGGTKYEVTATVPASAAYARFVVPISGSAGNNGMHTIMGRRMNGAELIVDGAITASKITTDAITAGHVSAGAITGDKIAVNAITADKVLISKGGNMLPDPFFSDVGTQTGWSPATYVTHDGAGTSGYSGGGSMLIASSSTQAGSYYAPNDATRRPKIVPGSSYRVSVWCRPSTSAAAGSFGLYLRCYNDTDNTYVFATSPNGNNTTTFAANTWTRHTVTFKVPEGASSSASVGLYSQAAYAGSVRFSNPSLQQAAGGELIVDGEILARHIKANEITANEIKGSTITASEIAANAVTATQLAANAVTANKILAGEIGTNHMTANSINADRLVAGSITAAKIAATAIDGKTITGASIVGGTIYGGDIRSGNTNGQVNVRVGPVAAYDPDGATYTHGLGFQVTGAGGVGPAIYSPSGQDLMIRQGGPLLSDGNKAYINFVTDDIKIVTDKLTLNGSEIFTPRHYYGTISQTSVPSATVWGIGAPTAATSSYVTDQTMVSWATDVATFRDAGYYSVTWTTDLGTAVTGRSFLSLESTSGATKYARASFAAGEDVGSVSVTNLYMAAGGTLAFKYYHTSAAAQSASHTVRMMRIG